MATPQAPWIGSPSAWRFDALVDEALARFFDWRVGADGAAEAYSRWRECKPVEAELRFAAYLAELDQEEAAAASFAGAVSELERWVPLSKHKVLRRL